MYLCRKINRKDKNVDATFSFTLDKYSIFNNINKVK